RRRDQRRWLVRSLAQSLILNESIKTGNAKAKAVVSYTEKLITKAKLGNLQARRQIIASLSSVEAAHKLVDNLAPKLSGRSSGYFKIEKLPARRGDNSQMTRISFVDDLKAEPSKSKVKAAGGKANQ